MRYLRWWLGSSLPPWLFFFQSDGPAIFAGDRKVLPGRIFKTLVSFPSAYLSGVIGYRSQVTCQSRCSLLELLEKANSTSFSFFSYAQRKHREKWKRLYHLVKHRDNMLVRMVVIHMPSIMGLGWSRKFLVCAWRHAWPCWCTQQ